MIEDELIQAMIVGNEDFSYSMDQSVNSPASIPNCITPLVFRFYNAFDMVFKQKPDSMKESMCDLLMVRVGCLYLKNTRVTPVETMHFD